MSLQLSSQSVQASWAVAWPSSAKRGCCNCIDVKPVRRGNKWLMFKTIPAIFSSGKDVDLRPLLALRLRSKSSLTVVNWVRSDGSPSACGRFLQVFWFQAELALGSLAIQSLVPWAFLVRNSANEESLIKLASTDGAKFWSQWFFCLWVHSSCLRSWGLAEYKL